jgi:hypothetical protein
MSASTHAITSINLPVLEDANSIQVAIMQVLRLILAKQLDPKTAGLLLYGLQTASLNLKHALFEPYDPTEVVIEPRTVADNYMGEQAWHPSEFEPDEAEAENEEPQAAATSEETTGQEKTGEEKPNGGAIPAQLSEKEKQLALLAKTRASIATLLAPLVKREQMQKSP